MNIIGCLDLPTDGRYLLDGVDVRGMSEDELADVRNRKIGFVFQSFNLIPRTAALANVELPMVYAGMRRKKRRRQRAEQALAARRVWPTGINHCRRSCPAASSSGSPSPAPSPPTRRSSSPTSPPATSTPTATARGDGRVRPAQRRGPHRRAHHPRGRRRRPRQADHPPPRRRDHRGPPPARLTGRRPATTPSRRWRRPRVRRGGRLTRRCGSAAASYTGENMRIAIQGIIANRMRSALTMLGILIGVAAVIVVVAVGNGSSKAVQSGSRRSAPTP